MSRQPTATAAYLGLSVLNPPDAIPLSGPPTSADRPRTNNVFGYDEANQDLYYCITFAAGDPVWIKVASGEEGIDTINADSGSATPAANALAILGGTGTDTVASGSTVTINSTGGGLDWEDVTGTSQALEAHHAYQANNGALVTFTLPATAAFGDVFVIAGWGAGGWSIAQNAGQTITNNLTSTTTGVGGSLSSSNRYDTVWLYCSVANTDFNVIGGKTGGYVIV